MLNLFKKKNNESWESIKASGKAFPKTKISILSFTGEDDEHYTAWINTGYKNYPYKEYCPVLGLLNVDYEDMNGYDIGEIQEYFDKELNKACVCHLISRVPVEGGIEILFYIEDLDSINNKLEKLYASEDLLVDFGCSLRTDANWETIVDMMEKYSS
ncbi:hypothetical protein [Flavobacterium sp.]|uniref:hypothetical protein n=1 Tax=Flavobacterium sp. TaxID=239 RepID=UPI00260B676F|nr:hypothetical protein [Flavobacterium sp.]